jgi:hypothetical protein
MNKRPGHPNNLVATPLDEDMTEMFGSPFCFNGVNKIHP